MAEKKRETGDIFEHMILEEVKLEKIGYLAPPDEWEENDEQRKEPFVPPVLIEEKTPATGKDGIVREYTLLAHHRSFWRMAVKGHLTIRAMVVRSEVHIAPAHESVRNCVEEALLFDALLRNNLVENRSRLSEQLGYSRARITQILNILRLPDDMRRKLLLTDEISEFQLRPIVRVTDPAKQRKMFDHLLSDRLTGRQIALFAGSGDSERSGDGEEPGIKELMDKIGDGEEIDEDGNDVAPDPSTILAGGTLEVLLAMRSRNGDWLDKVREAGLGQLEATFLKGVDQLRNGMYKDAELTFRSILEDNPDYAPAWFYLGKCGNLSGDLEASETALRTSLEIDPGNPDCLVELAMVLEKQKRTGEASSFYRKAAQARKNTLNEDSGD